MLFQPEQVDLKVPNIRKIIENYSNVIYFLKQLLVKH